MCVSYAAAFSYLWLLNLHLLFFFSFTTLHILVSNHFLCLTIPTCLVCLYFIQHRNLFLTRTFLSSWDFFYLIPLFHLFLSFTFPLFSSLLIFFPLNFLPLLNFSLPFIPSNLILFQGATEDKTRWGGGDDPNILEMIGTCQLANPIRKSSQISETPVVPVNNTTTDIGRIVLYSGKNNIEIEKKFHIPLYWRLKCMKG